MERDKRIAKILASSRFRIEAAEKRLHPNDAQWGEFWDKEIDLVNEQFRKIGMELVNAPA